MPVNTSLPAVTPPATAETAPFVVDHLQHDLRPNGHFTPAAQVVVAPALRTSGLLAAFPAEEFKSFLFLLTFLTANGRIAPTAPELAEAMRVSGRKASDRLRRLEAIRWQAEPVVVRTTGAGGAAAFTPAPHLLSFRETHPRSPDLPTPESPQSEVVGLPAGAMAQAVSRAKYGRPRAEVERLIARQFGAEQEEMYSPPLERYRQRLMAWGVPRAEAQRLISAYPEERIARQLRWINDRAARAPARYLVAAIDGDYGPPVAARLEKRGHVDTATNDGEQ